MKGKHHISIALIICIILFFLLGGFVGYFIPNMFLLLFFLTLLLLGSILPDSDSVNRGSFIFVYFKITLKGFNKRFKRLKEDEILAATILILFYFPLFLFSLVIFPIAFITNKLERLLIRYTKRPIGHRQSLHTIFGILSISLFWSFIFFIIYLFFFGFENSLLALGFSFLFLFFGQLTHLIEDLQKDWKIKWK